MSRDLLFKKTRFAPTPSGFLHIGNIYSFAVTSALAKKANAKIMLRIDDADMERTNKRYVQDIFDTLDFLGITWHEGPRNLREYENEYSQVHRMGLYRDALARLREGDKVFACTCSRTDVQRLSPENIYSGTCLNRHLSLDDARVSWRMRTNTLDKISVRNFGRETEETILPAIMQYFIVKKRDGFPAYQLTSLVDDCFFGIDLIVRGGDLLPSTLAQLWLSAQCGREMFTKSEFFHHALLLDGEGNKLSKSEGATSVYHLRQQQKKPKDIFGLIARNLNIDTTPDSWDELVDLL
jgi:glutamyl/glutaminyl-tRNA synthetase